VPADSRRHALDRARKRQLDRLPFW
jgi:hypothetical protein